MIEFDTEVLEVIQRTHNVKSFRFKTNPNADFEAGQFFFVTINIRGDERTKHFSFSNSPTEKGYIEFTKRITESDFSRALDGLKPGNRAKLKMPGGNFTLRDEHEKIAFLSGGIGITPIRSMCKFVTDMKLSTDIVLLYGNDKEEDIIFRQDLDSMHASNENIHVVYTLTSPEIKKDTWRGRTGLINEDMIKEEISDFKERVFYICGPPNMVKNLTDVLKNKLSIGEGMIRRENFAGY